MQSIRNKLHELEVLLSSHNLDVLTFTETFLTSLDPDSLLLSGSRDYSVFRCDRTNGRGGGVALFCRCHSGPVCVQIPAEFSLCEGVAVDLHGNLGYRIICIYRPPALSVQPRCSVVFPSLTFLQLWRNSWIIFATVIILSLS